MISNRTPHQVLSCLKQKTKNELAIQEQGAVRSGKQFNMQKENRNQSIRREYLH